VELDCGSTAKKVTFAGRKKNNVQFPPLLRLLKHLSFQYKSTHDGRKVLIERGGIVVTGLKFLRTVHDFKEFDDSRPVFCLDEISVNQKHTLKYF
jgi:hypothetical protein